MEQGARRLEHIAPLDQIAAHATDLENLGQQPDGAVVEDEHLARHARIRSTHSAQRDAREVAIGRQQVVLDREELRHALSGRRPAIVLLAKVRPGALLQRGQLADQQLFLGPDVAIDRARTHLGALGDGAQRRTVEAALAKQLACGALDAVAAALSAHQATVIGAQLAARAAGRRTGGGAQRSFSGFSIRSLIISIVMPA